MPIESIDLNSSSPITFRHPNINRPLKIGTGVSGISWSYNLNTFPQSTYGGEVVQVLSAYVGPITVHGQTTDNRQLRQIADWFLEYMQLAGLHNRDEHFITMEYAERGWSFWIQVNSLPDFHYNRDELAIEWSINAEITADNDLNYLSQMTMSAYTEQAFDPSMFDLRFMEHDKRNDPIQLDPSLGLKIGDNFQSMLGAWATGDFAHLAFDSTASLKANHLKNAREYWTQLYGSPTPFSTTGQGGGASGSSTIGPIPSGNSPLAMIARAAAAKKVPAYLMVASAMQESGLNPDARQAGGDFAMGLFQSFPAGRAGGTAHRSEVIQAFNHQGDKVTKYWPAEHQAADAAQWWSEYLPVTGDEGAWATRAQGAGDPNYPAKIRANIPKAKQMLAQLATASAPAAGGYGALAVGGLAFAGPDQGLDFTGQGSLLAVADGTIVKVDTNSGWPGGTLIVLHLNNAIHRPAIGQTINYVYYAEALKPNVKVGTKVLRGAVVATLDSSYPGSETGWAQNAAGSAFGSIHDGLGPGRNGTAPYGIDFGNYVKSL